MLIYVRISEMLKARVDDLISCGHYSDFNAVVTVALENLLVAEEEAGSPRKSPPQKRSLPAPASAPSEQSVPPPPPPQPAELPSVTQWTTPPALAEKFFAPLPPDLFLPGQRVPVERWVFGQQNRVMPAKVNARLLITLVAERQGELELFEAAAEISKRSVAIFTFLHDLDQRFGHGKDDLLSTGFPEPGSEKAISRYANHFAAYESTQGNLTGMLIQWKLAGIRRVKNKTYLLPTRACLDFAALPNPLLDHPATQKPTQKFSADETAWAINHISHNVPVEAAAFTTILAGLSAGATTPDALDAFVRENAREKDDVSPAFVSTQRSGAVSRMADLSLVRRQRDGTKVSYETTELGAKWLRSQGESRS
jgi:Arc/MetJ-type ribon-helix-helix transcriptional regulator